MARYLLLLDSYNLVFVGRPLWREDGPAFCICCWSLRAQSFSDLCPLGLATIFCSFRFETSLFVASYDSKGHDACIRPRLHTGCTPLLLTSRYIDSGRTSRKHIRLLAMDICGPHRKRLLRHCFCCCVRVFRALPRKGSARHSILTSEI
jgi:hypothetical protein